MQKITYHPPKPVRLAQGQSKPTTCDRDRFNPEMIVEPDARSKDP